MVSIITVNYNQTGYTCALLDSIRRQDWQYVEVLVVDNASHENPESVITTRYPEVKFIRSERNLGFAGGNNLAVRQSKGEYLFFVNNDAEITTGCIARLVALFEEQPRLGIVSPLICYFPETSPHPPTSNLQSPTSNLQLQTSNFKLQTSNFKLQTSNLKLQTSNLKLQTPLPPDLIQYAGMTRVHPVTARNRVIGNQQLDIGQYVMPGPTAYAHGAAMMVRREVMRRAGMMSEDFFLYYEELDWCERIRQAGYDVWIEPRARIYHKESVTMQAMSGLKTYYLNRNRVWFMRKHQRGWRLLAFYGFLFLVTIPKNAIFYWLKGDKENLAAFLKGVWWNFGGSGDRFERFRSAEIPRNEAAKIAAH